MGRIDKIYGYFGEMEYLIEMIEWNGTAHQNQAFPPTKINWYCLFTIWIQTKDLKVSNLY